MKVKKEPLFRIVKRESINPFKMLLLYIGAILLAMAAGALLLVFLGVDPVKYYKNMLTIGIIGNRFPYKCVEGYIKLFVPLLITSLALSLSFKMKFWNIGGEGQFIMGAISASAVALKFSDSLSPALLLFVMFLTGALVGGIYGMIVAVLKVKLGTNETLLTLMFNYIALYFLLFLGQNNKPWNFFLSTESVRPVFAKFPQAAWMPTISIGKFSLNISLIIAILINILILIYIKKTKQGYEIAVIGDSVGTARYAGMKVDRIVIRTMFISAFLIGLAGSFYVSSANILSTSVTNNVGWTGIIVAWLSKLNPFAIFITSILITILQFGSQNAASEFSTIDYNFANLLQGIILFLILAADFFIRFKIVFRKNEKADN